MSNAIFPGAVRGLTYDVTKGFEFSTIPQRSPGGSEVRIRQQQNPIWHFQLIYEFLKDNPNDLPVGLSYTDLQAMVGFMLSRGGRFDDFLFPDPDDNYMGPAIAGGSPNALAQLPLVNDGAGNYYSPLQRNMGGFLEDVTDLQPAGGADLTTLSVYANGVLRTSGYTVAGPGLGIPGASYGGLYIVWASMPAAPITAQFHFYFRVCFEMDTQDFDKWSNQWWTAGGPDAVNSQAIKLITARPAGV